MTSIIGLMKKTLEFEAEDWMILLFVAAFFLGWTILIYSLGWIKGAEIACGIAPLVETLHGGVIT